MLGTLPGEHWRITLGADDPKLTSKSAFAIRGVLEQRLHLYQAAFEPDDTPDTSLIVLSTSATNRFPSFEVTLFVNHSKSNIILESGYVPRGGFTKYPSDVANQEHDMARRVLDILKELYPNSSATQYTACAELLGP
jgi:hypothetical protein